MHRWLGLSSIALGVAAFTAGIAGGCASGNQHQGTQNLGGSGGAGPGPGGGNGTGGGLQNTGGGLGVGGGQGGGGPKCADFTKEAKALPAAMMFVLDMSASMKVKVPAMTGTPKYLSATQAIVTAIDDDSFDNTSIGLLTFPNARICPPQCLCDHYGDPTGCTTTGCGDLWKVSCGFPQTPQIAPADSGTLKSTDTAGVRHNIATTLQATSPLSSSDDGSPDYEALEAAYASLKAVPNVDKRFAILVSDGGFSCTSLSSPHRDGYSDGACGDWEEPDTVNALISGAYGDASTPINTFIVGVPGSNTNGGTSGMFANAPYPMLLALSTYAVSGSPDTVDPTCDKTAVFDPMGQSPNFPCHIDLSNGSQFTAQALAQAIGKVRGQALGCVFDLPDPPPGKMIDPMLVNVLLTINGMQSTVPRRKMPSDMCTTSDCWDYNAMNQVQLIGKACTDLTNASTSKVEIEVGCQTILK